MPQTHDGAMKSAAKQAGLSVVEYLERRNAGQKRCYRCLSWKPVTEFGIDQSRWDALAAKCTACHRVTTRKNTKGRVSPFKGRTHTTEARAKMRHPKTYAVPNPRKGVLRTIEERARISAAVRAVAKRGPECPSYKDGKLAERRGQRFSTEYKRWRFDVFARDHFTCQRCGDARGGNLRAHHVKSFAVHPELRFEVSNGITLCRTCHDAHHYA